MCRLTRRRAAILLAAGLLLTVGQLVAPAAALATPGDLATAVGGLGVGNATSVGMAPRGLAVFGSNLYISDTDASVIRKVDLGTGAETVIGGIGAANNTGDGGQATSAGLNNPQDVDVDASGNVYIAATSNHRIRKIDVATGVMSLVAGVGGSAGSGGDGGLATLAALSNPAGVAVSPSGDVYVADTGNQAVRKISGGVINNFATSPALVSPRNIALDSGGNVYVSDYGNNVIIKYPAAGGAGAVVAGTSGVSGSAGDGGAATSATLSGPTGIVIDPSDTIYVADASANRIRKFTVGGTISTIAGTGTGGLTGDGGAATAATLDTPTDIARDAAGNLYVAQRNALASTSLTSTAAVRKFTVGGTISTIAGNSWPSYSGDGGPATAAQLNQPAGVAVDSSDNLYVADTANNRIRTVTGGVISTIAGTGLGCQGACTSSDIGDGGAATSGNLWNPQSVTVSSTGVVYIADTGHHRIRKVSAGVITTVAGTGSSGSTGDGGAATAAKLNGPYGIFAAADGNLYIADRGNHKIRMITAGGVISTIAGTGVAGYTGDGGAATSATLRSPSDVRVDAAGDIYIADTSNNSIRKIHAGIISTVAGAVGIAGAAGVTGSSGDGAAATAALLKAPAGLEVDSLGNLYIADTGNSTVRRVDRHGIIHVVAGKPGSASTIGDGGAGTASAARLSAPSRLALDSAGNLYVAGASELRIRKLTSQTSAATFWTSDATVGHTGALYAWEFVSQTATAMSSITISVPSATNATAAGLYVVSSFVLPSTGTLSLTAGTLTYTLAAPVSIPAGQHLYLSVAGFANTAAAGYHYCTITTRTAALATIDVSRTGAISFTTPTSANLPLPNASAGLTVPAAIVIHVDPGSLPDSTVASTVTVATNATNGYTLSVAGTALTGSSGTLAAASTGIATAVTSASFGADTVGYTVSSVTGSGVGAATGGLTGAYAGYTTGGETIAAATKPTLVAGDAVTISNRIKVNYLQGAGVYTSTLTYSLTPAY